MQAAEAQRLGRKDDLFCTKTLGYASMNICKVEPKDFDEKHLLVMTYIYRSFQINIVLSDEKKNVKKRNETE